MRVVKGGRLRRLHARVKLAARQGSNRAGLPRALRHLKPGSYRIIAVAKAADGSTSKPAKTKFRVAAKKRR